MINFNQPYNAADFNRFLVNDFLPEDFLPVQEQLKIPFQSKYFDEVHYWGSSSSLNLSVYQVNHHSGKDARVGLTREMFRLMAAYGKRRSLVLMIPENPVNYRFSLVTIDLKLENDKVTREFSNPKRYSFILGEDAKTHTPEKFLVSQGRVSSFDDLQERFSVEVVNKEFYNQIAEMFSRLVGGRRKKGTKTQEFEHVLELPSTPYSGNEQKYKEFAVRLIGRTVFCWFLKKKKSKNEIPLIPEDVLSSFAISFNPDYYHSRVEPLFFNVLNTPMEKRDPLFNDKPYNMIPFLNGGLFEPQPDDYYIGGNPNHALKIPDQWWIDFVGIMETYNFTIDENTSIDIELSVDPEMLGRIFENLLAEINPETGESARKSTGSYYTPRPIVDYMVDESLKQYLTTKTKIPEEELEILLDYSREESGLQPEQNKLIVEALNEIKVLDPACGSGAFPMGILQKMLLILQKVDVSANESIKNVLKDIKDPVYRQLFEAKLLEDNDLDDYARKLSIIRLSIFGIDIQPIAIDISKLRFFLSLIVDEKIQDDRKNRGIEPLPNLEFKFVCANTLIPLPPNRELFENADAIEELDQLRADYFVSYGDRKKTLKKDFERVQKRLFDSSINLFNREVGTHNMDTQTQTQLLAIWNPFINESTPWFDPKWMFGETKGFDVIIGNPPYKILTRNNSLDLKRYNEIFKSFKKSNSKNIFVLFIEKSIQILSETAILSLIVPEGLFKTRSYSPCVDIMKNSGYINKMVTFSDYVFENAVTGSLVFVFNKNQLGETEHYHFDKNFSLFRKEKLEDPLIEKLKTKTAPLKNLATLFKGMVVKDRESVISINKNGKDDLFLLGKNISKWSINYSFYTNYIDLIIVGGTKKIEKYKQHPRILIKRTGDILCCTLLCEPALTESTLYSCWSQDPNISDKYLLALLNSKLLNYYNKKLNVTNQQGFPQILMTDLESLPIRTMSDQNPFVDIVECILKKASESNISQISILENRIDLMVYKLYELTYDEALLVDPELNKLISREDYGKTGIEELAEWKF